MNIYYTSCNDYIIKLSKLEDTKTNENRNNIENIYFALHRANKMNVIDICNKITKKHINSITCDIRNITYTVNEIVETKYFDDIEKEYGEGIYFYTSETIAFNCNINAKKYKYTGYTYEYFPNGLQKTITYFENGLLQGNRTHYNSNGEIVYVINFKNDIIKQSIIYELPQLVKIFVQTLEYDAYDDDDND